MRVKMSKQPPPAPTASAVGPCPTVIQIVGRPGTGSLPSTIAPPDHPRVYRRTTVPLDTISTQDSDLQASDSSFEASNTCENIYASISQFSEDSFGYLKPLD